MFLAAVAIARAADRPELQYAIVVHRLDDRELRLDVCLFDPEVYQVRVMDNINERGFYRTERLSYAMGHGSYVAGVNAGFFNVRAFTPLGLQISNGQRTGELDMRDWLKGIVMVKDGQLALLDRADFEDSDAVTQLVQSGPWLIVEGKPGDRLDKQRAALRTFICRGADGRWAIGVSQLATMDELVEALQSDEMRQHMDVVTALNLDGGPSTGFWMWLDGGAKVDIQEQWPVRNYLGLYRK